MGAPAVPSASPRSPQAIQSRDRIQLQYSQSLIEKDQYRKQVRELEAERDELLTSLTSLEGAKALLEAQLQRTQGGPCLKVSSSGVLGARWVWSRWDGADLSRWREDPGELRGRSAGGGRELVSSMGRVCGSLEFWGRSWDTKDI